MNQQEDLGYALTGINGILTTFQTNDLYQFIGLCCTVLMLILNAAYTIYKWHSRAKKDGKITHEEVGDLIIALKDQVSNQKHEIEKEEEKEINE